MAIRAPPALPTETDTDSRRLAFGDVLGCCRGSAHRLTGVTILFRPRSADVPSCGAIRAGRTASSTFSTFERLRCWSPRANIVHV